MHRVLSQFDKTEVYIGKGQSVEGFLPALSNNNVRMKPDCQEVSVHYLRTHIAPKLFQAHWEEVGQDKSWEVDMNWPYYEFLESQKMLRIVVLLLDAEPVGYFVFVVSPSLHYRTKVLASSDMFYIMPEHRAQYAVRLFRAAKASARAAGAHKFYLAFKVYKDITALTKRLGFKQIESVAVTTLE